MLPLRDKAGIGFKKLPARLVQLFYVAPSHHRSLHPVCTDRAGARRAIVRRRDQENLFHTHAQTAQKEKRIRHDEEISHTHAESEPIEEIVASAREGIGDAIGYALAEKEEIFGRGRGISDAGPEEEKDLVYTFAECLAASKKEKLSDAGTL